MNCIICENVLSGRQKKFCSVKCKNRDINIRHNKYVNQSQRGTDRKIKLIFMKGNKCEICGYNKNAAAFDLHHRNPKEKSFSLDLRRLSNSKWSDILEEAKKCDLLCSNCHRELHNPRMKIGPEGFEPPTKALCLPL